MLFRKKIEKSCSYCQYATELDEEIVLCIKHGVKSQSDRCTKFLYDPCKRTPAKQKTIDFKQYEDRDFTL